MTFRPMPAIPSGFICMLILCLVQFNGLTSLGTVRAAEQDKERWNSKYANETYLFGRESIYFLKDHVDLLPKGAALDLAMGEGRNAVYLSTKA